MKTEKALQKTAAYVSACRQRMIKIVWGSGEL